ncbi:hypothetical protein [Roseivivax sediminis]|uniref:Uncharacterized protein n=1 Tax=Roseivivax sediminis TaxID=936889 RepID=A0A1I1SVH0_9RHOB|nr:hypothetical protein [Roseivivax sediminis]SFD50341.1 hypothetical protein SAMN04515678_101350 [Roseivivax sediminis]
MSLTNEPPIMDSRQNLLNSAAMAVGVLTQQSGPARADERSIVLLHGANVEGRTWGDVYHRRTA